MPESGIPLLEGRPFEGTPHPPYETGATCSCTVTLEFIREHVPARVEAAQVAAFTAEHRARGHLVEVFPRA